MNYEQKYLAIVRDIVLKHIDRERYAVFLFGSRASGENSRYADVDVGIEGHEPLDAKIIGQIHDELEQSLAPYHVDIVDFHGADQRFKEIAKQRIIPWNPPPSSH